MALGGGGSRGSYQMGVWKALDELGYEYDIVCGTSVGALNGALMVQNEFEKGMALWSTITTLDVLDIDNPTDFSTLSGRREALAAFISRFVKEGGVDPAPLERLLRQTLDEDKVRSSPVDFGLVTVEFPSMTPLILTKENIPEGMLCDFLMASAACYPAMKSRQIQGKRYVDGGYHSNLPIEIAINLGADEIVAVDLECIGIIRPVHRRDRRIKYIKSHWDLGVFLHFEPQNAYRNMILGYNDTMKSFGQYEGEAYTFARFESEHNRDDILARLEAAHLTAGREGEQHRRFLGRLAQSALGRLSGSSPAHISTLTVRRWAEAAGKALALDPLPVYTFADFNRLIQQGFLQAGERMAELSLEALASARSFKDLLGMLTKLDRSFLANYLLGLLQEPKFGDRQREQLSLAAALTPLEFMAAYYGYALSLPPAGGLLPGAEEPALSDG